MRIKAGEWMSLSMAEKKARLYSAHIKSCYKHNFGRGENA